MFFNKLLIVIGVFLVNVPLSSHVVDIHFPSGEELQEELKDYEMDRRRSDGDTFEIEDENGNKKEIVVANPSKKNKDRKNFNVDGYDRSPHSNPPDSRDREMDCYENASYDR